MPSATDAVMMPPKVDEEEHPQLEHPQSEQLHQPYLHRYTFMLPTPLQTFIQSIPPMYLASIPLVVLVLFVAAPRTCSLLLILIAAFYLGRVSPLLQLPAQSGMQRIALLTTQRLSHENEDELVLQYNKERSIAPSTAFENAMPPKVCASMDRLISFIVRDFINGWYAKLNHSNSPEFPDAVHGSLREAFSTLGLSASRINPADLILALIGTILSHLREYKNFEASQLPLDEYMEQHPTSIFNKCATTEQINQHLRDLSMRIAIHALPRADRSSPLVFGIVREIVGTTVLLPLVNKFSDPDWLNGAILNACEKSPSEPVPLQPEPSEPKVPQTMSECGLEGIQADPSDVVADNQSTLSDALISDQSSSNISSSSFAASDPIHSSRSHFIPISCSSSSMVDTSRPVSIASVAPSIHSTSLPARLKRISQKSLRSLKRISRRSLDTTLQEKTVQVYIKVVESRYLPVINTNTVFCTATVGSQMQTSAKKAPETNPAWDLVCWFDVFPAHDEEFHGVLIEVLSSKTMFTDEIIGRAQLAFSDLEANKLTPLWLPIDTELSRQTTAENAEILIEAVYIDTKAMDDSNVNELSSSDDDKPGLPSTMASLHRSSHESGRDSASDKWVDSTTSVHVATRLTDPILPPPQARNAYKEDASSLQSNDLLSSKGVNTDVAVLYRSYIITRGGAAYLSLYDNVDVFSQMAVKEKSTGLLQGGDWIRRIQTAAITVIDNTFGHADTSDIEVSFGDVQATLVFYHKLRREIVEDVHPQVLYSVQDRIQNYFDHVFLAEFKLTEPFRQWVGCDASERPLDAPHVDLKSEFKVSDLGGAFNANRSVEMINHVAFSVTNETEIDHGNALHTQSRIDPQPPYDVPVLRLDKLKSAIRELRDQINAIDVSIRTAAPDTFQKALESKFVLQTDIESLMEMVSEEEYLESEATSNSIVLAPFFDLEHATIRVVDAAVDSATSSRSKQLNSFLGLGSIINATGAIAAQTFNVATQSAGLGGTTASGVGTSSFPTVAFEFSVNVQTDPTNRFGGWRLAKTFEEFERLHRLLCVHFSKANLVVFPTRPNCDGIGEDEDNQIQAATVAMFSTGALTGSSGISSIGMLDAQGRLAQRIALRQKLATELEIYINALTADPLLRLSSQVVSFLAKPAIPTGESVVTDDEFDATSTTTRTLHSTSSNVELQHLVLRAFKNAGSAFKKVASGDMIGNSSISNSTTSPSMPSQTPPPSLLLSGIDAANRVSPLLGPDESLGSIIPSEVNRDDVQKTESSPGQTHLRSHETLPEKRQLSRSDLNVILECTITAIEEVFQLTSPTQWIRQQGLHMVRVVLHQTYGSTISSWLQRKIEKAMSETSVRHLFLQRGIAAVRAVMMLMGTATASTTQKTDTQRRDTRRAAKAILLLGRDELDLTGDHAAVTKLAADAIVQSPLRSSIDTLGRIVGRHNATMGIARLFNMVQVRRLNITLICLLLECIVKNILNQ
ncbi:hypothetical protein BASA60_004549 [Batrachochytrium salamandrivorans]|nr:hypothetical protein BASA60_004549 [Batrachochytrium salamandrivorans]